VGPGAQARGRRSVVGRAARQSWSNSASSRERSRRRRNGWRKDGAPWLGKHRAEEAAVTVGADGRTMRRRGYGNWGIRLGIGPG